MSPFGCCRTPSPSQKGKMHKDIIESLQILEKCSLDEVVKADTAADRNYWLGRAIGFRLAVRVIDSEGK